MWSRYGTAVGMVAGSLFVLLGIAVIVPTFGVFGLVWTALAGVIAVFYAYNFFSSRGVSAYEVNVESPESVEDLDASLREHGRIEQCSFDLTFEIGFARPEVHDLQKHDVQKPARFARANHRDIDRTEHDL